MLVANFAFYTYDGEANQMGSGSTMYIDRDYSTRWINFLLCRYQEAYAKMLFKYAEKNKKRIKQEAEAKIEKLTAKVKEEAKGPYTYYKDLATTAKRGLTAGEISEIEEEVKKGV